LHHTNLVTGEKELGNRRDRLMSDHFWCGWCARRVLSRECGHEYLNWSVYGRAPCPGRIPSTFLTVVLSLPMPSKNLVLMY